jgi:DNA-binding NarL/FixJ family response regulator
MWLKDGAVLLFPESGKFRANPQADEAPAMAKAKKQSPRRSKILIVDDHPAVREGLALRIAQQPNLRVCGEAGEIAEAIHEVEKTKPDLVIVDLTLKNGHGLELIKRLKTHYPSIRILVWSMHPESLYAERVVRAGALGYVNKEHATERIIDAITQVLKGEYYLSESAVGVLQTKTGPAFDLLSDRELETFELLGKGLNTTQVAAHMHLSPKTVETYRSRIKEKLNLHSGTELMQHAMQWVMEKG